MPSAQYDPAHRYVRDLVTDGFIGTPRLVDVQVMTDFGAGIAGRAGWLRDATAGGGMLMQLLSHYVDLLHFTFGDLAVTWCDTSNGATDDTASSGAADDTAVLLGELPGGGRVALVGSWTLHHPAGVAWQLYGTEGAIRITTDTRVLGGRAGGGVSDLGIPDGYLPAVGAEALPAYDERRSMGWAANTPMLASLAAEFAANVAGTATAEPVYATFADGLWFHDALGRAAGPSRPPGTRCSGEART